MRALRLVVGFLALSAAANSAAAQQAVRRFEQPQDTVTRERAGWSPVRVVKWGALAASTGALVFGFAENRGADREYEDIERLCLNSPEACATNPDGNYADPDLEARYQNVVSRDDRARLALLAGQIGLAASVLLFIIDLPEGTTPDDIPYDPRPLRLSFGAGQIVAGLRVQLW